MDTQGKSSSQMSKHQLRKKRRAEWAKKRKENKVLNTTPEKRQTSVANDEAGIPHKKVSTVSVQAEVSAENGKTDVHRTGVRADVHIDSTPPRQTTNVQTDNAQIDIEKIIRECCDLNDEADIDVEKILQECGLSDTTGTYGNAKRAANDRANTKSTVNNRANTKNAAKNRAKTGNAAYARAKTNATPKVKNVQANAGSAAGTANAQINMASAASVVNAQANINPAANTVNMQTTAVPPVNGADNTGAVVNMTTGVSAEAGSGAEEKKKKKISTIFGDILFYVLLIGVIAVVVMSGGANGGPKSLAGFSVFTVLSSSMEDVIPKGSLVVSKKVEPETLEIGDDITFMANSTTTITHRIIGITEDYEGTGQRAFETKGTMNSEADKEPVAAANLVGKVVFHNYTLGKMASVVHDHWIILLVLLVLIYGFFTAVKKAAA